MLEFNAAIYGISTRYMKKNVRIFQLRNNYGYFIDAHVVQCDNMFHINFSLLLGLKMLWRCIPDYGALGREVSVT